MKPPSTAARVLGTACVTVVLATQLAFAAEPPRQFRADPPDAAAYTLPDPLVSRDGRKITTAEQWLNVRRPEVLELFREHVYGRVPATPYRQTFTIVNENPRAMHGAATLRQIAIKIEAEGGSGKPVTINLSLFVPNARTKPAPAFLLICNRSVDNIDPTREKKSEFWPAEEGIARGYAMAAFFNGDVDPDKKDSHHVGIHGLLGRGAPASDAWGTLAAWAWGASRCLDYLQTDPAIAKEQVAVIGHSRGGKTALWAGAEDQRFALVCSNDSGCGGAALTRHKTTEKETLPVINRAFPHWFNANFKTYDGREAELPVDQHMLMALIAPRAVAVHSAEQDLWADPRGEFLSLVHARAVFQLFGRQALDAAPRMPSINEPLHGDGAHYHIREGKHNLTLVDWTSYWDFADRVFARPAAAAGWRELFNGKDLTGWRSNADPGAFTVTDGVLKAHATHPTNRGHLFFTGTRTDGLESFRNFELEAVVRGEPGSNSGIFFHTDMETRDGRLHLKNGYEVQLNSSPTEKRKTGSLYDVVDLAQSPVDEANWFTVGLRVQGQRITVQINGKTVVDYTEPPDVVAQRSPERKGRVLRPDGGAIALQAHDDKSTFYFKSIRVRPLP